MVLSVKEQQVKSRPIANARFSLNTSGAFGESVASGLGDVATVFEAQAKKLKEEKDHLRVMEQDNALTIFHTDYLSNTETGVYAREKKDADEITAQAIIDFEKKKRELEKGLSPDQLKGFSRLASQQYKSFHRQVASHELEEMQKYRAETANTGIAASATLAASHPNDTEVFNQAAKKARAIIDSTWSGSSKASRDEKYNAWLGVVHSQSTKELVSMGRIAEAEEFFNEAVDKGYIDDPEVRTQLRAMLTTQVELRKSQAVSDELIGKHGDDYGAAIKGAEKQTNPNVRKNAVSLIDSHFAREERLMAQSKRKDREDGVKHINNGGTIDTLPADLAERLKGDEGAMQALENRQRRVDANIEPNTQRWAYQSLTTLLANAARGDKAALKELSLLNIDEQYGEHLDNATFRSFVDKQESLLTGSKKAKSSARNDLIVMKQNGASLGDSIDAVIGSRPSSKNSAARRLWDKKSQFLDEWVQREVTLWQSESDGQKKLPPDVRATILHRMEVRHVKDINWFQDIYTEKETDLKGMSKEAFEDAQNEIRSYGGDATPSLLLAHAQATEADRAKATKILRDNDYALSEKNIMQVIAKGLEND